MPPSICLSVCRCFPREHGGARPDTNRANRCAQPHSRLRSRRLAGAARCKPRASGAACGAQGYRSHLQDDPGGADCGPRDFARRKAWHGKDGDCHGVGTGKQRANKHVSIDFALFCLGKAGAGLVLHYFWENVSISLRCFCLGAFGYFCMYLSRGFRQGLHYSVVRRFLLLLRYFSERAIYTGGL